MQTLCKNANVTYWQAYNCESLIEKNWGEYHSSPDIFTIWDESKWTNGGWSLKWRQALASEFHPSLKDCIFMRQLITRSVICSQCEPGKGQWVSIFACVYELRRVLFHQRLSHEVTVLHLLRSGMTHKRGSHYITKTQIHICFYYVTDEQQNIV